MPVVELDFYEPDGTTLIGTLDDSQLIECEVRPALFELGAIRFVVSRHLAAASSALLAKGNIVKVTYPVIDADPIAAFVLKDDVSQLIDDDEEGGEHLTVTGPGALWLLQHARLREEVYAPGQPTRGDWDDDVSWNWRGRPYGGILVRAIEEGQNQPGTPLSAISIDFSRTEDSDGQPWAEIAEDFSVPIGTDVLALADRLATAGDLFLVLTPDMVLHAYQTYGRDLTGAFAADNVRFEKDVNILTELQRKSKLDRVTHLITRDMDAVYRTYVTPDAFDQAVYGFHEMGWTNDPDQIEKTALAMLAASDDGTETYAVEVLPGLTPEEGEYLPGPLGTDGHFWYGDDVTLHTGTGEHDLNAVAVRVTAVSIVLDIASDDSDTLHSARSLHIVPELVVGTPAPAFSGVGNSPGATGGVGCVCPKPCQPFVTGGGTGDFVQGNYLSNTNGPYDFPSGLTDSVLIIIAHQLADPGPPDPSALSVTVGGVAATFIPGSEVINGVFGQAAWYVLNPTPNDSIVFSAETYRSVMVFENVNQALPISEVLIDSGTGTTPNLDALAGFNSVWSYGGSGEGDPVQGAGQTVVWSESVGFYNAQYGGSYGETAPSWTLPFSAIYTILGIGINGSSGGFSVGDGPAELVGSSIRYARCDHNHLIENLLTEETDTGLALVPDGLGGLAWGAAGPVLSDDTPEAEAGAGDPGDSEEASRSDHVHPADEDSGGGGGGSFSHLYEGTDSIGGSWQTLTGFRAYCKAVTFDTDVLLTSIDAYLRPSTDNLDGLHVMLLDNNAGAPGKLIAANMGMPDGLYLSNSGSMPGAGRWVSIPITPEVVAGDYWIAVLPQRNRMDMAYAASGSDRTFNTGFFIATGAYPSAWTITDSTQNFSIRVGYIPL